MRRDHEMRPRRSAAPLADHVADRVDAHVLEPEARERVAKHAPARGFVERRRRHFAEPDLVGDCLSLRRPRVVECRLDLGLLSEGGDAGR